MTTTVKVKARAHGAIVSLRRTDGSAPEETTLGAFEEREFLVTKLETLEVKELDAPETKPVDELFEEEEARLAKEAAADDKPAKAKKVEG